MSRRLRTFREVDERFDAHERALKLQAGEYKRRLAGLNHESQRIEEIVAKTVTQEKYEAERESDKTARDVALKRVDERFDDHVKRYELRQRELDQALDIQTGAAAEVKRAVDAAARKQTRNLTIAGLILAGVIAVFNTLPL